MEYIIVYGYNTEAIILQETNEFDSNFIIDAKKNSNEFNFLEFSQENISAKTFANAIKHGISIKSYDDDFKDTKCPKHFIPNKHGYGNDGGKYVFVSPLKNFERDENFIKKVGKEFHGKDFDENSVRSMYNPFLWKNYLLYDDNFNHITVASNITGTDGAYYDYYVIQSKNYDSVSIMYKTLEKRLSAFISADLLENNIYALMKEKDEKEIEKNAYELKEYLASKGYDFNMCVKYNFQSLRR